MSFKARFLIKAEDPLLARTAETKPFLEDSNKYQCKDASPDVTSSSTENLPSSINDQRRPSVLRRRSLAALFTTSSTQTDDDPFIYSDKIYDEKQTPSLPRSSSPKKMVEKIDAIQNIVGDWGKWQFRTVFLIFLCKIPSSWFMACIIFTAPAPRHGEFYCKPPSTLPIVPENKTLWTKIIHPILEEADDKEFKIDFCNVYQDALDHASKYAKLNNLTLNPLVRPMKNSSIIPCGEFEHHAEYTSLITQFDLVCSRDILVATTQFWHLFGVLCGGIVATKLLEYISPRKVMYIGMFTQIFCGNLTGWVNSYSLHVFFRCLSAVCCCQMYTAGQMIFQDITGGKHRTIVTTLFETFWSVGVILLPGVASFWSSWTYLYMAISCPTVLLIFLQRWVPDSPRWFIKRGRVEEAKEILIESARINGRTHAIPADLDYQLQIQAAACLAEPPPAGWWSIWKGPRAKCNMVAVHLAWSIYIVVYYGMLLNIRAFSRDHLEINTVIAGISEILGVLCGLFLILNTTKKWMWTGFFNVLAGMFAYTAWLIPPEIKGNQRVALLMLSAMISKIAISCTLAILTTSTTELVSGEKKKICGYSTIVWARIWLLTAPFVGVTIIFGNLVPQSCFASLSILGGLITASIRGPRTLPKPTMLSKLPPEFTKPTLDVWTVKEKHEKIPV